jgi:hypothetical protein
MDVSSILDKRTGDWILISYALRTLATNSPLQSKWVGTLYLSIRETVSENDKTPMRQSTATNNLIVQPHTRKANNSLITKERLIGGRLPGASAVLCFRFGSAVLLP